MPAGEQTENVVSDWQYIPVVHSGVTAFGGVHPGYLKAPHAQMVPGGTTPEDPAHGPSAQDQVVEERQRRGALAQGWPPGEGATEEQSGWVSGCGLG
jgi:hypothetical protein